MTNTLPTRDQWVGERVLTISSINFAFALIEFKEFPGDVALASNAHAFLYSQKEQGAEAFYEWVSENNKKGWLVTLKATDDREYEHGPNHCGLVAEAIATRPCWAAKPAAAPTTEVAEPKPGFFKRYWQLLCFR